MDDDETHKRVCHNCIGEAFLSQQAHDRGIIAKCDYCGDDEEPTISVAELADEVEGAFGRHFERTSPDPSDFEYALLRDKEIDYDWEREGQQVLWAIYDAANVSENIAQDVLDILEDKHAITGSDYCGEEDEFSSDSYYEEKGADDFDFRTEWNSVEESIKQRTRFFNREAERFFAQLFANLDKLANRHGAPVIVGVGPEHEFKSFYRARAFHNEDELVRALKRPDWELGPPPSRLAKAGRMNAQGISVFYGASDASAAIAEIRPPVGSRVLVGRFDIVRPIRLLDVEALQSVYVDGSHFDPAYIGHLELAKFLGRLSERMTMPVMPDDEPTEYLITQMIADFVAQIGEPPVDGMLYRSVQCAGEHKNVVLFNHAARVVEWEMPSGTEVEAHTFEMDEDGGSVNYWVSERVPAAKEPDTKLDDEFFDWAYPLIPDEFARPLDARQPTLNLNAPTLQVHHVSGVTIQSDAYDVSRHRYNQTSFKFGRSQDLAVVAPDF
jgi:RES domain/HEPN/RES N-terminal domain 1